MIEFLQMSKERKLIFIAQTATETGMKEKAVEKDWWVTLLLRAIFTLPMAEHFVFKGGTSLSKGWGLIERLSESFPKTERLRRCPRKVYCHGFPVRAGFWF